MMTTMNRKNLPEPAADLSATFATINHSLMMHILENDFGIHGVVKRWLKSYLDERQQRVKHHYNGLLHHFLD